MPIILDPDPTLRNNLLSFGWECGEGWRPLIQELIDKLDKLPEDIYVTQIKEKFGTLRFYIMSGSEIADGLIEEYEHKSAVVCEVCGQTGRLRERGRWYKTLCDSCAVEHGYRDA